MGSTTKGPRSDAYALLGILLLAVVLRALHLGEMQAHNPLFDHPAVDEKEYLGLASSILDATGESDQRPFYHPPGYAYFVALALRVFGRGGYGVRCAQILVEVGTTLLLFVIGRRTFGQRIALGATLAYAVYVPSIFYACTILPPTLLTFLTLASTASALSLGERLAEPPPAAPNGTSAPKRNRPRKRSALAHAIGIVRSFVRRPRPRALAHAGALGLLFSFLIVTLPNFLLVLPVLLAFLYKCTPADARWHTRLAPLALVGATSFVFPVLATVHNATHADDAAFISYNGGLNFFLGNNPNMEQTVALQPGGDWDKLLALPYENAPIERYSQESAFFYREGLHFVRTSPWAWFLVTAKKALLFFNAHELPRNFDFEFFRNLSWVTRGPFLGLTAVMPLGVCGLCVALAQRRKLGRPVLLLAGSFLVYAASIVLFFVAGRYRIPVIPILILFAAYGVSEMLALLRARAWPKIAVALVGTAIVVFAINAKPFYGTYRYEIPNTKTYALMGYVFYSNDELPRAIQILERGLAEPTDEFTHELHYYLAHSFKKKGDDANALFHMKQAFELKSSHASIRRDYAGLLLAKGERARGIEILEETIRQSPCYAWSYADLAAMYEREGDRDRRVAILDAYRQNCPSVHPSIQFMLGSAYMDRHEWDRGVRIFEELTRIPRARDIAPDVLSSLGSCYYFTKRYADARDAFERALRLRPEDAVLREKLNVVRSVAPR